MNTINDGGLLRAALGTRGDLDAWLEVNSEDEVRAAILALANRTLRDDFAAKALQGICASSPTSDWTNARIAQDAYALADAMLAAREAHT